MAWANLTSDEKSRVLGRAAKLRLTEAHLSSTEDLEVKAGGLILDPDQPGSLKPTKIQVQNVDELVNYLGHPKSTHESITAAKVHQKATLLSAVKNIAAPSNTDSNFGGRTLNQLVSGIVTGSVSKSDLTPEILASVNKIAAGINIGVWLFPNIVIDANSPLIFQGNKPQSLIANKITIKPGGRIISNKIAVQISCNTLEVQ